MRFRSVDVPAFGRPMRETKPARGMKANAPSACRRTADAERRTAALPGLYRGLGRAAEADLVDTTAFGFEDLDVNAIELERLPHRRHPPHSGEHVAANRFKTFRLDLE